MLDRFEKEIEFCTYCPKLCRFACPVAGAQSSETVTPWGKMTALHLVRSGAYPLNQEIGELIFQCVECRACQTFCKHEIACSEVIEAARQYAFEKDVLPERVRNFIEAYHNYHNPYRKNLKGKLFEIGSARPKSPEGKVLYFIGCTTLASKPDLAQEAFRILDAMGIRFDVYLADEVCCGMPALNLGDREAFLRQARAVSEVLNRYELVISGCPGCIVSFKQSYPRYGVKVKPRLRHISEVMAEAVEENRLPIRRRTENNMMYHDSCHLGRYLGIYDAPRAVLNRIGAASLKEFSWNRASSNCCGGGGGHSVVNLRSASAITQNRLLEFHESGADTLVVGCPSCLRVFSRADKTIDVQDLITIADRCL